MTPRHQTAQILYGRPILHNLANTVTDFQKKKKK